MIHYLLLEWISLARAQWGKPSQKSDPANTLGWLSQPLFKHLAPPQLTEPDNPISTLRNPGRETIRQFVIYAENKVGWLNDFFEMLLAEDIHIMAISVLDTTDSAVIRLIPNYPKETARLLKSRSISFTERKVLAVELEGQNSLQSITQSLLHAEINIHYVYPFLYQPNQKPVLAIAMEDEDTAEEALAKHHLKILSQEDFAR